MNEAFFGATMFDYEEKPSMFSAIKIGRITFAVFAFLSWWIFIYSLFSHPTNKEENFVGMLLGMIMFFIIAILTIIGTICIFYLRAKKRPYRFWIIATGIAALPMLIIFIAAVWYFVSRRLFHQ